ncbi:peptidoglycan DD-metalloendopeptidase family protein [Shewanella sp. D64]|uniref:peptidoglycan DD-metalloendopeptidase family protein n=1 Tax=unclassified Shewanella TaxID=196818 RepID=UPI0022BA5181|nr:MULTISPECIES: peptidoglycan DD-metalloendopeptidase family protein [unclassified Shewanella]MEC4728460.1 peptidoglycan DD-metalloendopeptidase family protein [Shewanella sp. D64]MEC4740442.1 peptidoglycan DD-metalloendopeptidase family protein [Shewanella sp. E94]WBJ94003.1 peptidoglycan DD-metalloendopeptidase family protein [Shewanella sp. MTB7]
MKRNRVALVLGIVCLLTIGCSFQSERPAPVASVTTPVKTAYNKGALKSDFYHVKQGDTLYSIAWASDNDFIDLANKNKLKKPYTIFPGQKLNLDLTSNVTNAVNAKVTSKNSHKVVGGDVKHEGKHKLTPVLVAKSTPVTPSKKSLDQLPKSGYSVTTNQQVVNDVIHRNKSELPTTVTQWLWPVKGKVIGTFSAKEQGSKGIKIAGQRGDIIKAAADGRVVYAGSALRGYGNLVIVKHSDDYLSAYAHADSILVKEKQFVTIGQTLAKMGNTGTDRVMLHFEIRRHGKSVNPLKYLPK